MASVTYKIGGKYDGKGIKSAKKDLSDLAKVVKGMAVLKVAQQLGKIANATKSVFLEQNKALNSFNIAVAKSNIEISKLNNLKKELSHNNFIDDDSINNAMKLGMQMGLNAEQLEKVTKTAINMASAGVKPLDKAMKDLSKTALTNGDELDVLMKRYDGFADALSGTFSGRDTQWKNSISDLKASVGGIFQSLEFISQGKLLEPLNKITNWLKDNTETILKVILNLPTLFKTVLKGILTPEFLSTLASNIYNMLVQAFKNGFKFVLTLIDTTLSNISNGLYAIFEDTKLGTLIKNVLSGNGGADQIERQKQANLILKQKGISAMQSLSLTDAELSALGLERIGGKNSHTYATKREEINFGTDAIIKNIEKLATSSVTTAKDWKNILSNFWGNLEGVLDANGTIDELKEIIMNFDMPEDWKKAWEGVFKDLEGNTGGGTEGKGLSESAIARVKAIEGIGTTALSGIGEIGSFVTSALQNGIWGVIAELLSKILTKIAEVSPIFDYFRNIFSELLNVLLDPESGLIKALEDMIQPFLDGFNAVKEILGAFLNIIGGIINSITPVLEGLTIILNKIAPIVAGIFELIALFFNSVGTFLSFLNPILEVIMEVIAPVLEVINKVIKLIYMILAEIINVIISIYNAITWGAKKDKISTTLDTTSITKGYEKYNPDLSGYASASASVTSGSASYTSARDIYVNIYYNNSYINGDAREIALNIRNEIRSAEKLGY